MSSPQKEFISLINLLSLSIQEIIQNTKTNLLTLLSESHTIYTTISKEKGVLLEKNTKDLCRKLESFVLKCKHIFQELKSKQNLLFHNRETDAIHLLLNNISSRNHNNHQRISSSVLATDNSIKSSSNIFTSRKHSIENCSCISLAEDVILFTQQMKALQESIMSKEKDVPEKKRMFEVSKRKLAAKAQGIIKESVDKGSERCLGNVEGGNEEDYRMMSMKVKESGDVIEKLQQENLNLKIELVKCLQKDNNEKKLVVVMENEFWVNGREYKKGDNGEGDNTNGMKRTLCEYKEHQLQQEQEESTSIQQISNDIAAMSSSFEKELNTVINHSSV